MNNEPKPLRLTDGPEFPMPRALGEALMEADSSLERFSRLSEKEKREFIGGAQSLTTGYEMRNYVRSFVRGEEAR